MFLRATLHVFLDLHYQVGALRDGRGSDEGLETAHATDCALAGGILCSTFNAFACVSLGWKEKCELRYVRQTS